MSVTGGGYLMPRLFFFYYCIMYCLHCTYYVVLIKFIGQCQKLQCGPVNRQPVESCPDMHPMTAEVINAERRVPSSAAYEAHSSSDMWTCTHRTLEKKPLLVARCVEPVSSGHWNADRGVWIMDRPTEAWRSTHSAISLDRNSHCSALHKPSLQPGGRDWLWAKKHWEGH